MAPRTLFVSAVTLAALQLLALSAAAQSMVLPLRGNRSAALWITAPGQTLTLLKRDLNIYAGADTLA